MALGSVLGLRLQMLNFNIAFIFFFHLTNYRFAVCSVMLNSIKHVM